MTRLNLGPGSEWSEPGWEALDISTDYDLTVRDLQEYAPGSVDRVYTSHCLEHLEFAQAAKLIQSVHRVMAPGGVLRVVVPDVDRLYDMLLHRNQDYLEAQNHSYYSKHRQIPFAKHIESLVGWDRFRGDPDPMHFCFFTRSILGSLLRFTGFEQVWPVSFKKSAHDIDWERQAVISDRGQPVTGWDNPYTAFCSLYMEAVK